MKILSVLSQLQVTGAETYALSLADALKNLGHETVLVSDRLKDPLRFIYVPLPIHSWNTSYLGRVKNILSLHSLIKREQADLLHSHSRAANLISHFASNCFKSKRVPMIVTVHGRWRNTFAFRRFTCLGSHTIAVCPYLKRYLSEEIGVRPENISMIPNGIDTQLFAPPVSQNENRTEILFVGRFNGQKGKVIRYLLSSVYGSIAKNFPEVSFKILAFSPSGQDLKMIREINRNSGREAVKIVGPGSSLPDIYRGVSVVVGSGRVALEALSCGKPVISIGESSAPGLLTHENFDQAFDSNFGDCGEWDLFSRRENFTHEFERILSDQTLVRSLSSWGREIILSKFDSKKIALQVEQLYQKVSLTTV